MENIRISKNTLHKLLANIKTLVEYTTPIIVPFELIDRLGYINNYYCYIFEIGKTKYNFSGMIDLLSKLKKISICEMTGVLKSMISSNFVETKLKLEKYITFELLKFSKIEKLDKCVVSKISRLFETSSNNENVKCDFLRPNMIIGSLCKFNQYYNNSDLFANYEIGKIFRKNTIGIRCEKEYLSVCVYHIQNSEYAINYLKEILNELFGEYVLKKIKNDTFKKWKIMVNSISVGSIYDRYDFDCSYFNKNNDQKILMKVNYPVNNTYTEILPINSNITFFEDELQNIIKSINCMNEDEKMLFRKKITTDGFYSLYSDFDKKFFLLKKDMFKFNTLCATNNHSILKVPCIYLMTINIAKLN